MRVAGDQQQGKRQQGYFRRTLEARLQYSESYRLLLPSHTLVFALATVS
ncbi:MAG: hypothetical protein ACOVS5_02290 [Oligoflexus sp.]